MSKYQVKLYETREYIVEVEAEDEDIAVEEAMEIVDEEVHFNPSVINYWEAKKITDPQKG